MISVIIPVYNAEDYLHVCINSVLKQTYQDFEIICIDDDSTDSSLNILDYFSSKNSKIKVFKNGTHSGRNFCKKKGLEIAHGDYIYFLDSNGWLDLNAFEILIPILEKSNLEALLFKKMSFDEKFKEFKRDPYFEVEFMKKFNLEVFSYDDLDNILQLLIPDLPLNKIYLKKFLDKNNIFDDDIHSDNVLVNAQKISFLDNPLFEYRVCDSKTSNNHNLLIIFDNLISKLTPILGVFNNEFNITQIDFSLLFNMMNTIEEFLIKKNLFNYFEIPFLEYKLSNLKNCFFEVPQSQKEEFYNIMREEFIGIKLRGSVLKQIDFNLYKFYIQVLNYDYLKFNIFNLESKRNYKYIIKKELDVEIENFEEIGINIHKRKESIVVSLTSFPERLFDIHYCLYSLLKQSLKPDKIILCLVRDDFPNGEEDIPKNVLNLKKNGLTIKWCDDLKSFTKLIPVLNDYPNDFIITVDDDIFYPEDLIENLWDTYKKYPNTIISSRSRIIKLNDENQFLGYNHWDLANKFLEPSFLNFITGVGGVLYFPNALSDNVFRKEVFEKLCPTGDDIWFWAMAVLNNTKITGVSKPHNVLNYVNISRELRIDNNRTLASLNLEGHNDIQIRNVLDYFPDILKIINND